MDGEVDGDGWGWGNSYKIDGGDLGPLKGTM